MLDSGIELGTTESMLLEREPASNNISGAKKGVSGLGQRNCPLREIG
jgi:hypothetical protein